ncbi:aldo/keto reductase [Chengkuizengella sp. SCS-71B]|uniref:aldo/keto reductase n=1 Tax=Chengkuizengella sp. SCS-71B TaxID=3115290 RepID=UPI0032C2147F
MDKIKLGSQGLEVSKLGLGCMGMSEFYGETNESESLQTLKRALELGITFFDTSDVYGYDQNGKGTNETLVGKGLREHRNQVQIATKFGVVRNDSQILGYKASPDYVVESCESSLKRLGTDYIDLYYLHRADPNVPIEETVGAMAKLVEEGKVRYIGLCEVTSEQLTAAHAVHPITALQTEYSLWSRDVEAEILKTCRELNVGFVPYSPLGRGFLTGEIKKLDDLAENDWRRANPRFTEEAINHNLNIVRGIESMAKEKKCTPAQLALAWVLSQGNDIVPIPGTKRIKYLEQNVGALDIHLSKDDLKKLNELADSTFGSRY